MPNTRHQVAADVATAFLPAKLQTIQTAATCYEALSVMLEARATARMPEANFGSDILERMRRTADAAFAAQQEAHEVHALLAPIREKWRIAPGAYGPNDSPEKKLISPAGRQTESA